jgi:hypothetical protein
LYAAYVDASIRLGRLVVVSSLVVLLVMLSLICPVGHLIVVSSLVVLLVMLSLVCPERRKKSDDELHL